MSAELQVTMSQREPSELGSSDAVVKLAHEA